MSLSEWVGKKVRHKRKAPNDHIISVGILQKTKTGHYEIKMEGGGYAATFSGDTIEYKGKKAVIRY